MDVSGTSTIHLDRAGVAARRAALAARVDDLTDQRREVAHAVESMLPGWRGAAAESFRTRWDEWREGADAVIAALGADLAALDLAAADLDGADAASGLTSARLQGRLG